MEKKTQFGVMAPSSEYSENTAMKIYEEVSKIVTESYDKVKTMLQGKKDNVEKAARALLEKEVIEGEKYCLCKNMK